MSNPIFLFSSNDTLSPLNEKLYEKEEDLQAIIADHPVQFWQCVKTNLQAGRMRLIFAAIHSTVDYTVAAKRTHHTHLETLKRGLMQDLLTGRVRVPVEGGEARVA